MKGTVWRHLKKFGKRKLTIMNSVTVPKNVKGGTSGFSNIYSVAKLKGETLWCNTKIFENKVS